ncbi:MAG: hypothetical protein JO325_07575 [Solirubrobacterales bacterium]|nr:hypothetical protein [Solirubrobacterales bacterium]
MPAGQIMLSSEHQRVHAGNAFSFAEGRTGAGVSAVTLTLDDGATVQATVGGGWFVAWWPGGREIKSAELATPAGAVTQTFNFSPEIPCREQRCSSGTSAVGGGGPGARGSVVSGFASGGGGGGAGAGEGEGEGSTQNYAPSR